MTDIVERLRDKADENYEMLGNIHEPLLEAATEIARLRAALREIAKYEIEQGCPCNACEHSALASAALEGRT